MIACCVWCLGAASWFRIPSAQASCVCVGGTLLGLLSASERQGLGLHLQAFQPWSSEVRSC